MGANELQSAAQDTDTIAAIATPAGQGGIGIVRISGPLTRKVTEALVDVALQPRRALFTKFRTPAPEREILDEGIVIYFPAPKSFTGEDVAELQVHGSPVVLQRLLQLLVRSGVRLAHPGEFSERAFLNDKIDLAQAEAIADLISSASVQAARAAIRSLQGEFSKRVNTLAADVERLRLLVEATIDFPEEDEEFLADYDIPAALDELCTAVRGTLDESQGGEVLGSGCDVALIGLPNAGKSSLLNELAGEEAAIVSDIPGTTRDLLKVDLILDGLPIRLVDTAGLRDSDDAIEQLGVAKARAQIEQADVILLVVDGAESQPLVDVHTVLSMANITMDDARLIVVNNKQDKYSQILEVAAQSVDVSAKTGIGLAQLVAVLKERAGLRPGEVPFLARARHIAALEAASTKLENAQQMIAHGVEHLELVAEELKLAHLHLGEIVGVVTPDEMLGKIFSEFCIGK